MTSATHSTHPNTQVTPDGAVQLNTTLGLVAEAKPGVARGTDIWERNLQQLKKYDDPLLGWWTPDEKLKAHDIVALVPMPRVVEFTDLVKAKIADGTLKFARPLAVVGFFKSSSADDVWISLKTELGNVTDPSLNDRLRRSVPVDWKTILTHYNDVKFIDTEPPLPYKPSSTG
ncbi:MAG TPA: hypothetical protein VLV86_13520 [Vicinamibacterales bacterium]|nr:hypothetical protein [Vicinamibacterales bacterium]